MTTALPTLRDGAPRRIVLIDFDWQDADLLPDLLRQPTIVVGLVAGREGDDAGVRVAELCGVPSTTELSDLTREIFDVALVGDRSARRPQIEALCRALGTSIVAPRAFFETLIAVERRNGHEAAGRDALSERLEDAIPRLDPEPPGALYRPAAPAWNAHDALPEPDDRLQIERFVAGLVTAFEASTAEVHASGPEAPVLLGRGGAPDPLLTALVELAQRLDAPQVVSRAEGPQAGRIWGAWPFRSDARRGVLAIAAARDPRAGDEGARTARALALAWSVSDLDRTGGGRPAWDDAEAFTERLALSIERHRRHGLRFGLHRLLFPGRPECVESMCRSVHERLRSADLMCRVGPLEVLVLCAGPPGCFEHVFARIRTAWAAACHAQGIGTVAGVECEPVSIADAGGLTALIGARAPHRA